MGQIGDYFGTAADEAALRRIAAILNRFEAAVRMCYPDDMTPNAKRVFDGIIEDERGKP